MGGGSSLELLFQIKEGENGVAEEESACVNVNPFSPWGFKSRVCLCVYVEVVWKLCSGICELLVLLIHRHYFHGFVCIVWKEEVQGAFLECA